MLVYLLNALAIVGGLITIYEFSDKHEWVVYLYAPVLVLAIILPVWRRLFGYWIIRRDLSLAEDALQERGITPNIIISFDRSSGIFAGMLAQRLGIGALLALPRTVISSQAATDPRHIVVGTGVKVEWLQIDLSKALVVVFHLRTGATLNAGMEFLKRQNLNFDGNVLALYSTKGGVAAWPKTMCVHVIGDNFVPNENFPWIRGKYRHL